MGLDKSFLLHLGPFKEARSRLREFLRSAERVLRGRWIDKLESALEVSLQKQRDDSAFAIEHSVRQLAKACSTAPEIAVISCMPPAQTGIGTATLLTFRESVFPVDIYAHYAGPDDYLYAITDQRLANTSVRIFHLGALALGQHAVKYRAQIYVLGNSNHNFPIVRALRLNRQFQSQCRLAVHIHDPCLLNVLELTLREERRPMRQVIKSHYEIDIGDHKSHQRMVDAGIFGIRAIIGELDVDVVIVNTTAAAEIVRRELPDCRNRGAVSSGFRASTRYWPGEAVGISDRFLRSTGRSQAQRGGD